MTAGIVAAGASSICIDNVRNISRDSERKREPRPARRHRHPVIVGKALPTYPRPLSSSTCNKPFTARSRSRNHRRSQALADAVVMATRSLSVRSSPHVFSRIDPDAVDSASANRRSIRQPANARLAAIHTRGDRGEQHVVITDATKPRRGHCPDANPLSKA